MSLIWFSIQMTRYHTLYSFSGIQQITGVSSTGGRSLVFLQPTAGHWCFFNRLPVACASSTGCRLQEFLFGHHESPQDIYGKFPREVVGQIVKARIEYNIRIK